MCFGRAQQPKTDSCRNYVKLIRIIMVFQLLIALLNFIAYNNFLKEAIFGIIFTILLYAAQNHLSYQILMLYIFVSIFFAFRYLLPFLQPFQNNQSIDALSDFQKYTFIQSIISFAYYTFTSIFFYFPYKQFKLQAFSQNPALQKYFERQSQSNDKTDKESIKRIDYDLNYGNIIFSQKNRDDKMNIDTFEVQKGKGIVIG